MKNPLQIKDNKETKKQLKQNKENQKLKTKTKLYRASRGL